MGGCAYNHVAQIQRANQQYCYVLSSSELAALPKPLKKSYNKRSANDLNPAMTKL